MLFIFFVVYHSLSTLSKPIVSNTLFCLLPIVSGILQKAFVMAFFVILISEKFIVDRLLVTISGEFLSPDLDTLLRDL